MTALGLGAHTLGIDLSSSISVNTSFTVLKTRFQNSILAIQTLFQGEKIHH